MAFKKIPLTIDTMIRNPVPVEGINQEDNVELNIVVTENKTPKDLSSQTIKVYVRRIDGTLVEQTNQITLTNARKGEVTVKLKNSAFNKEGYALFQLDVSDSIGRITSSYATFKIGKGLVSGEAIANTNEIEALKKVEEYIKKANQELETFKQTVTEINENEATRQENEVVRVREEASRNKAEAIRVQQEATRKEKENERVQAEIQRIADEEVRRENEALRGSKELERKQAEELRKEKELLRIADENNRKVAESKRIETESVRVEAEKLRVAAETGRVRAENLRVTAEEERVAAETKREEGFNKFEGKINANTKELKNARTATTGEKFNSLDERIDCEVDRLNKKIEVSFLQQEDKESHTIENTVDGMTTDMVVKGRTLQNVMPELNKSNFNFTGETNLVDGFFIIPFGVDVNASLIGVNRKKTILKPNTKYTVIADILENNTGQKLGMSSYGCSFVPSKNSFDNSVGISMITGTTKDNFNDVEIKTDFLFCIWGNGGDLSKKIKFKAMVLEGDWTNKPIPKYFEGIKSFGQQEDKISILSRTENLLDTNLNSENVEDGVFYDYKTGRKNTLASAFSVNIPLKANTTFSMYGINRNVSYWKDGVFQGSVFKEFADDSFTTQVSPNFDSILKVAVLKANKNLAYVILGDKEMNHYQQYKQDKKDILIKEPLRSVGNISDIVYEDNGQVKIDRYVKEYTFTGDENVMFNDYNGDYILFYFEKKDAKKINFAPTCNNFKGFGGQVVGNEQFEFINQSQNGNIFYINILKSKLTTQNVEGFKAWLKANPTTIIYQLAEPTTEIVENCVDIDLKTFNEKTYVSFENAISGTSSFKAPVNAAATISRLNRENRALEEENKTLRQDFESTTLSLTDSDLELVKQNVDIDFRLMEVEFALDIPQSTLSSNINFKKKGEVKSMARTPYAMMKIVILSGDYDREDYIHKVGKYYERGRMTKEEYDELMSLMTADEVIGG